MECDKRDSETRTPLSCPPKLAGMHVRVQREAIAQGSVLVSSLRVWQGPINQELAGSHPSQAGTGPFLLMTRWKPCPRLALPNGSSVEKVLTLGPAAPHT